MAARFSVVCATPTLSKPLQLTLSERPTTFFPGNVRRCAGMMLPKRSLSSVLKLWNSL